VREKVLFAAHNALKDPPFSKLDMVSCRNMLIYLNRDVQEQLMELFHFTLRPGGYLFLGGSESADSTPNLFTTVDKKSRVYKANVISRTALRVPTLPLGAPVTKITVRVPPTGKQQRVSFSELHQRLLEQYAPPSVIINYDYDIVHLSDRAGRFLQFAGGEPSHNLLKVIHPELRLDLRTALFQAIQTGKSTEARRVRLKREGHTYYVNMIARPVLGDAGQSSFILVIFDEVEEILGSDSQETGKDENEPIIYQLELELHRTKEQLQATIEQYETSNEEMKASNEELQAINEELRSASEELETSKEELQSINEELTTVNFELKSKVDEVSSINDDLKNLISSTEIATIFVDRAMRIKRYTLYALDIFNLIPTDVGRSLFDITHRINYEGLANDAAQVFDTLLPIERELTSTDGRWYIARLFPYRTLDDHIDGAVLTFVEITERKQAEVALRNLEEQFRLLIESVKDYAILTLDPERRVTSWNSGAAAMFGYTADEIIGQSADILFTAEDRELGLPEQEAEQARNTGSASDERWRLRKDGTRFYASIGMAALPGEGFSGFVKIARDLTVRQRTEEELRQAREALEEAVQERTQELSTAYDSLLHEVGERETEVLRLIAWGYSNKEIANRFNLSVKTVERTKPTR
jgi:two-component system, chemotaxis family, CheB/CheR fusion protein